MALFQLGNLVVTRGVSDYKSDSIEFLKFIFDSIDRYLAGDWGDTCAEDAEQNNNALKNNERLLAVYNIPENIRSQLSIPNKSIWIITERDRSVTTILFPSEY